MNEPGKERTVFLVEVAESMETIVLSESTDDGARRTIVENEKAAISREETKAITL